MCCVCVGVGVILIIVDGTNCIFELYPGRDGSRCVVVFFHVLCDALSVKPNSRHKTTPTNNITETHLRLQGVCLVLFSLKAAAK